MWQDRIVGTGSEDPNQLLANPRNWRVHPKQQQDALAGVLDRVGWVQQVIVNRTTGHLVDGHLRVSLAMSRDEAEVPVVYVELSPEEEALILATLDPLSAMAGEDREVLGSLLASLSESDQALAALTDDKPIQREVAEDDVPDLPAEPKTKPGDLWLLGEHRVLCGDSTDPAAVDRALADAVVDLVWTDPPYGVAYQTKLSKEEAAKRRRRSDGLEVSNDDLGVEGTGQLLRTSLSLALERTRPGGCWWVASPSGEMFDVFAQVLAGLGVRRHTLVWVKDVFVMGRADYHYRHESLFYGWKPGASHREPPDRKQDTVWEIPRPKRSEEHPTMKPVELVARAVQNHTVPGELVYDPFLGSGTTLIAAEQTGRRCVGLELDPAYCDVIVQRWEALTGQKAVLDA